MSGRVRLVTEEHEAVKPRTPPLVRPASVAGRGSERSTAMRTSQDLRSSRLSINGGNGGTVHRTVVFEDVIREPPGISKQTGSLLLR